MGVTDMREWCGKWQGNPDKQSNVTAEIHEHNRQADAYSLKYDKICRMVPWWDREKGVKRVVR